MAARCHTSFISSESLPGSAPGNVDGQPLTRPQGQPQEFETFARFAGQNRVNIRYLYIPVEEVGVLVDQGWLSGSTDFFLYLWGEHSAIVLQKVFPGLDLMKILILLPGEVWKIDHTRHLFLIIGNEHLWETLKKRPKLSSCREGRQHTRRLPRKEKINNKIIMTRFIVYFLRFEF